MAGKVWIELLSKPKEFEKFILSAMNKALSETLKKSLKPIENEFSELVYSAVYNCIEMEQIRSGTLRHELGLSTGQANSASEQIARAVGKSVFLESQGPKGKRAGGLSVNIQPTNFANVLSIPDSTVDYFSKRSKELVTLEWLDWLLTRGDAIIVGKFHFEPRAGRGRTGSGRMEKGDSWRVNSQFSGTVSDNFITRALSGRAIRGRMERIIEKAIKKNWN
tara:strand:+ start:286 stop:948 length:663 start_codon:yes stop_codon:yes gene_type:complete